MNRLLRVMALVAGLAIVVGCTEGRGTGSGLGTASAIGGPPRGSGTIGQPYCLGPRYAGGTACASIVNPYERNPTVGGGRRD